MDLISIRMKVWFFLQVQAMFPHVVGNEILLEDIHTLLDDMMMITFIHQARKTIAILLLTGLAIRVVGYRLYLVLNSLIRLISVLRLIWIMNFALFHRRISQRTLLEVVHLLSMNIFLRFRMV